MPPSAPPSPRSLLPPPRFQALSPLLTVDGVRVGHLVHVVGSLVGASVISGEVLLAGRWVGRAGLGLGLGCRGCVEGPGFRVWGPRVRVGLVMVLFGSLITVMCIMHLLCLHPDAPISVFCSCSCLRAHLTSLHPQAYLLHSPPLTLPFTHTHTHTLHIHIHTRRRVCCHGLGAGQNGGGEAGEGTTGRRTGATKMEREEDCLHPMPGYWSLPPNVVY